MIYLGVDLGGTKTEIAAITLTANKLEVLFRKRVDTLQTNGYEHILNNIATLYDEAKQKTNATSDSLGIGIPGSIAKVSGLVRNANLQALNGKSLLKDLTALIDAKIFISNDANCLALSEHNWGAAKGCDNSLAMILGTGVGAGIVLNNKLLSGANLLAGELGHLTLDIHGPKCWCGNFGCAELYLAGPALEKYYFANCGEKLSAKDIYAKFQVDEPAAIMAVDRYIHYFSTAIANYVTLIDPEVVVLGGGMSNMEVLYSKGYRKIQEKLTLGNKKIKLVKSKLGDSSGVFGAAALCIEQ